MLIHKYLEIAKLEQNSVPMMPEQVVKVPRSVSPVARAGAGDISERELSRERHNLQLQTTPPA